MIRDLSSRQIGEWLAFGLVDPVGQSAPPEPEQETPQNMRHRVEGGLRALRDKFEKRKGKG
jgi:hypothetical protein